MYFVISQISRAYSFFLSTGLVPKQQKKILANKDTKKPLPQPVSSGAGPVAAAPQAQPQLVQSKPQFVPTLDSSQLMAPGFDPLDQFMTPHLVQSNAESSAPVTPAAALVSSGLLNANMPTNQTPTDTHPFLNQHPIVPSPGRFTGAAVQKIH